MEYIELIQTSLKGASLLKDTIVNHLAAFYLYFSLQRDRGHSEGCRGQTREHPPTRT